MKTRHPFKGLCYEHLGLPGYKHGSMACRCRRHAYHKGPHRAQGRLEWLTGHKTFVDIENGNVHEL